MNPKSWRLWKAHSEEHELIVKGLAVLTERVNKIDRDLEAVEQYIEKRKKQKKGV